MARSGSTQHGAAASRRATTSSRTSASSRGRSSSSRARSGATSARTKRTPARSRRARAPRARLSLPRIFSLRTLPLLLAGLLIFGTWTFYPTLKLEYAQSRQNALLENELQGLQKRNRDLAKQVERLKTPEGVEDAARESLGMVRPGEHQYVVTGASSSSEAKAKSAAKSPTAASWWTSLLDTIFGFDARSGK